jgi:hypothetical protein
MAKTISAALCLLTLLIPTTVSAVTIGDLPTLEGHVFAVQIGANELVEILVLTDGKYREYRFDPTKAELTLSAEGEAGELEGAPNYLWKVNLEGEASVQFTYSENESGATLHVDDVPTGLVKVDYSISSQSIPVLVQGEGWPGCLGACMIQGCCPCCYCVHRRVGVPETLDWLCCRWAGVSCD